MGVPTSEVGYTFAMPRREDHEVHKDMWGHCGGDIHTLLGSYSDIQITMVQKMKLAVPVGAPNEESL